jgi:site-specific recombinase
MVLHDAYAALRQIGLVSSHAVFSTGYLNKGARYYDHLICSRKPPAVAALLSLFVRINAIAKAFMANPSLTARASDMAKLARAIWAELEQRSCALLPANRKRPAPVRAVQGQLLIGCS